MTASTTSRKNLELLAEQMPLARLQLQLHVDAMNDVWRDLRIHILPDVPTQSSMLTFSPSSYPIITADVQQKHSAAESYNSVRSSLNNLVCFPLPHEVQAPQWFGIEFDSFARGKYTRAARHAQKLPKAVSSLPALAWAAFERTDALSANNKFLDAALALNELQYPYETNEGLTTSEAFIGMTPLEVATQYAHSLAQTYNLPFEQRMSLASQQQLRQQYAQDPRNPLLKREFDAHGLAVFHIVEHPVTPFRNQLRNVAHAIEAVVRSEGEYARAPNEMLVPWFRADEAAKSLLAYRAPSECAGVIERAQAKMHSWFARGDAQAVDEVLTLAARDQILGFTRTASVTQTLLSPYAAGTRDSIPQAYVNMIKSEEAGR